VTLRPRDTFSPTDSYCSTRCFNHLEW